MQALADRARMDSTLNAITLCHLHVEGHDPCEEADLQRRFFTRNLFVGKHARAAVAEGRGT
jgi:hypothetical protein